MAHHRWQSFDITSCCHETLHECSDAIPTRISWDIRHHTVPANNNGMLIGQILSLNTNYTGRWNDGYEGPLATVVTRTGLRPGTYVLTVTDNGNQCVWQFTLIIKPYNSLNVQLLYDTGAPVPYITSAVGSQYYQTYPVGRGQSLCFRIVVSGGVPSYTYLWRDSTTYGTLPLALQPPNEPAIVNSPILIGSVYNTDEICVLTNINQGSGWVQFTVSDSTGNSVSFYIKIIQQINPL